MINLILLEEKKKLRLDYYARVISVFLPLLSFGLIIIIISFLPTYFFTMDAYQKIVKESQSAEALSKKTQQADMLNTVEETNQQLSLLMKPRPSKSSLDFFNEIVNVRRTGMAITNYSYN